MNLPGDFIFAWPWAFALFPLPALAWWLLPPKHTLFTRALRVPSLTPFQAIQNKGGWRTQVSLWLLAALLGWALVVLATARPQWLGEPVKTTITGRDLLLAIDISRSMLEDDMRHGQNAHSRMEVVRELGNAFISRRVGDRVGLILFGEQAYVQTPLTFDHATVQHFLSEAQVGLAGNATAIGDAIGLGVKRLRDRPEQSRVLVLLTDGANSAGVVDPLDAARVAAQSNIRIHTVGVGSDPRDNVGFFSRRVSGLDEASLQQIAQISGGQYFRARNVGELEGIYARIDQLEPVENEEQTFRPLIELFVWPLGAALLLSVLWCLMHLYRAGVT